MLQCKKYSTKKFAISNFKGSIDTHSDLERNYEWILSSTSTVQDLNEAKDKAMQVDT